MNMEHSFMMDNDSGYVSHNLESNLDLSVDNTHNMKTCLPYDYLSEDALLEKPPVAEKCERFDSFDSVINDSQDSIKTEFSGLEDSDRSDASFVIPVAKPIVWDSSEWKENSDNTVLSEANNSKGTNKSFGTPSKSVLHPHKVLANVTNTYDQNTNSVIHKPVSTTKENIRPSETPKKYENLLNSAISPDLFSDEEDIENSHNKQKFTMKKTTPKESYFCDKDTKLLKNIQSGLSGLNPPPSVTILQMTVAEMLDKINENKTLFWKSCSTVTTETKSLLLNDKVECIYYGWPEILKARHHGLHYNRNKTSEELEHLGVKYAERYIGAETQSSCTVFESNPSSSQKRKMLKPRWGQKSPGRRLSHLARRRITFSSANLQSSSSSAILGSRARQILVDARKLNVLKKSPRKSPRKTPSKSPFKIRKNTPSSSAKKKLALRFRQMSGEFESTSTSSDQAIMGLRRSLFGNDKDSGTSFGSLIEKKSTKRALFSSPLKNSPQKKSPFKIGGPDKKRKRTDFDESNPSKLARSVSMDLQFSQSSRSSFSRTLNEQLQSGSKPEELSDQHKKKLQWAVYESLRLQNVTPTHPQYKIFASVLARVTRKFLPSLKFEGRTTEKMFRIARHHSYAVVKGKTMDEIVNEYLRNKMKNQKPQGYVGIDEFNKLKNREDRFVDKENILQEKNNIESIEKGREHVGPKTRFFSQNRIDRIKKVISFEEKDL